MSDERDLAILKLQTSVVRAQKALDLVESNVEAAAQALGPWDSLTEDKKIVRRLLDRASNGIDKARAEFSRKQPKEQSADEAIEAAKRADESVRPCMLCPKKAILRTRWLRESFEFGGASFAGSEIEIYACGREHLAVLEERLLRAMTARLIREQIVKVKS